MADKSLGKTSPLYAVVLYIPYLIGDLLNDRMLGKWFQVLVFSTKPKDAHFERLKLIMQ